jgi:hypothetical protein
MASAWNALVKKVFQEGKAKNPNYKLGDAMKDASKRKHEMGSASSPGKSKRRSGGKRRTGKRKTRRHR